MKRMSCFFLMILTASFLHAQEVPFTENEEVGMTSSENDEIAVSGSDTAVPAPVGDLPVLSVTATAETDESRTASEPAGEAVESDDALVWDGEDNDGEESLADAAASTAEIPIRLRAEAAASKEWEEVAAAVRATDAETKLVLAVLTDIHVKAIRITEDTETGRIRKKMLLDSLEFEKKNRIRSVLDKDRYKIYRNLKKKR